VSVCLLHISDSHLFTDQARRLKGICPWDSFKSVLADAYERYPEINALLLGGDMAQDETAESYQMLVEALPEWRAPVMLSPGNHANLDDIANALVPALQAKCGYCDVLQIGNWRILAMNTHKDGQVSGYVTPEELARLDGLLAAEPEMHTLIVLHHPPLLIGSKWMDAIGFENASELWDVVLRRAQVRVMLHGHIHQAFDREYAGIRVLGSPSTSVQFAPGKDSFELDAVSPGYRCLQLHEDGSIHTEVHRINGFIPPDLHDDIPY